MTGGCALPYKSHAAPGKDFYNILSHELNLKRYRSIRKMSNVARTRTRSRNKTKLYFSIKVQLLFLTNFELQGNRDKEETHVAAHFQVEWGLGPGRAAAQLICADSIELTYP